MKINPETHSGVTIRKLLLLFWFGDHTGICSGLTLGSWRYLLGQTQFVHLKGKHLPHGTISLALKKHHKIWDSYVRY